MNSGRVWKCRVIAFLEGRREHLVLDHQRRHAHQGHRVLVEAAPVAADVEHADHVAAVVGDRRRRAGQEVVRGEEVLVRVDRRRRPFGDRGADRIRPLALLGPGHARRQRDAVGLFEKVGVAQRMHDHALRIRQQHHVVRVGDLLVQRFHRGYRMAIQEAVLFDQVRELGAGHRAEIGPRIRTQPELFGAPVRDRDHGRHVVAGNEQACRVLVSHSMSPGWPWTAALCWESTVHKCSTCTRTEQSSVKICSVFSMLCFMQHTVSKLDASFLGTRNRSCAGGHGFAIVRVLLLQRTKSLAESIG
jgi:hypothetical protein